MATYSLAIADEICERLAAGESLNAICSNTIRLPSESAVRQWVINDTDGFAAKYTRAREKQADFYAESILQIADQATNETFQSDRLRIDARKWFASKVAPKKYGDRIAQEISGTDGKPLTLVVRRYDKDKP